MADDVKGKVFRNNAPLTSRVKKMMQADEDVGKVAKATPVLIAKALDVFLSQLTEGAVKVAEGRGARILTTAHVKSFIHSEPLFDFCQDAAASAPDLPPPGAEEAGASPRAAKRTRATRTEDGEAGPARKLRGGGRGGGAGRGRGRGRGANEDAAQASPDAAGMREVKPEQPAAEAAAGEPAQQQQQQQQQQDPKQEEPAASVQLPAALLLGGAGAEAEEEDYDADD